MWNVRNAPRAFQNNNSSVYHGVAFGRETQFQKTRANNKVIAEIK